jgi:hypothetical protein
LFAAESSLKSSDTMPTLTRCRATALLCATLCAFPAAASENGAARINLPAETATVPSSAYQTASLGEPSPSKGVPDRVPDARKDSGGLSRSVLGGSLVAQTVSVRMGCFPERLRAVLAKASARFGGPVIVTSGFRASGRRGSYHRKCLAADIQIAGVAPSSLARFLRGIDDVGGVGTYGHTRSVHVDVGERVFTWYGSKRRRTASLGGAGCCPACAAMAGAQNGGTRRFEASCTG